MSEILAVNKINKNENSIIEDKICNPVVENLTYIGDDISYGIVANADVSSDGSDNFPMDDVQIYENKIESYNLLPQSDVITIMKSIEEGTNEIASIIQKVSYLEQQYNLTEFKPALKLIESEIEILNLKMSKEKIKIKHAKNTISSANLRLVFAIAKKFVNRGLQFIDLVQEGNIGLMKSIEKFDYRKGINFSSYAALCIRQAILQALADQGETLRQDKTVRTPLHNISFMNKVQKTRNHKEASILRLRFGIGTTEQLSLDEVAEKCNLSRESIRKIQTKALRKLCQRNKEAIVEPFLEARGKIKHKNTSI